MNRRRFLIAAAGLSAGSTALAQPNAAAWPDKPVRIVVPYAAGGPTDVAARLVADSMSRMLTQPIVVENITGAGTVVGTGKVAGAQKDGHTLLIATVAHAVNAVLYPTLPFDPIKDFQGVALIGTVPQIVLVNNDLPVRSMADLLVLARRRPGGLGYGSAGLGSAQHLAAELLARLGGIEMVHVPYRGSGLAVSDLIAARLDVVIDSAATALQYIKAGSVRPLAVTGRQRLALLPDLPTVAETLPGYEAYTWNAVLAPAGTPAAAIAAANAAVNAALAVPGTAAKLGDLGTDLSRNTTPADTDAFVSAETTKWQSVLRSAGVTPK